MCHYIREASSEDVEKLRADPGLFYATFPVAYGHCLLTALLNAAEAASDDGDAEPMLGVEDAEHIVDSIASHPNLDLLSAGEDLVSCCNCYVQAPTTCRLCWEKDWDCDANKCGACGGCGWCDPRGKSTWRRELPAGCYCARGAETTTLAELYGHLSELTRQHQAAPEEWRTITSWQPGSMATHWEEELAGGARLLPVVAEACEAARKQLVAVLDAGCRSLPAVLIDEISSYLFSAGPRADLTQSH